MKIKNVFFYLLLCIMLSGCIESTALLGPSITAGATGNVQSAGLSYGTNVYIKKKTGKTTAQNLRGFLKKYIKIKKEELSLSNKVL